LNKLKHLVKVGLLICGFAVLIIISNYHAVTAQAEKALNVVIEWPNEGEVFYVGPTSFLYSIPIKGRVESSLYQPEQIKVYLKIFSGNEFVGELSQILQTDRSFVFYVTVNPAGSDGNFPLDQATCADYCHLPGEIDLPKGNLTIEVVAVESLSGEENYAYRHVTVDLSTYVEVPVQVYLAGEPEQLIQGVVVSGSTRLYLWRARHARTDSEIDGIAYLEVEVLSQSPTVYEFMIEPSIVDGVLYKGIDPVIIEIPPGGESIELLSLAVHASQGEISGRLVSPETIQGPLSIWAIHQPDGAALNTLVDEEGNFIFSEIEIGEYIITTDDLMLLEYGFLDKNKIVDLKEDFDTYVTIPIVYLDGKMLNGVIKDDFGAGIPFAWIKPELGGRSSGVLPNSSKFTLIDLPEKFNTITIGAPGFYSRQIEVDLSGEPLSDFEVQLDPQPKTIRSPWGQGSVLLPSETDASISENNINLNRGWLWGEGGNKAPLIIQTDRVEIEILQGRFVLEYLPGSMAWLYIFDGQAQVHNKRDGTVIFVQAGQMVNLFNQMSFTAVSYHPAVKTTLNRDNDPLLPLVWEPSPEEKMNQTIEKTSIGIIQVITLLTYVSIIAGIIFLPLFFYFQKRKNEKFRD
jgi:hypothetical protein